MSTPGKQKSLLDHGGNHISDLWFASPTLYQVTELRQVGSRGGGGGGDILELSLVRSFDIRQCVFMILNF